MKALHLVVSLLLTSCLPGGFANPDTEFGVGVHCASATDAKGGPRCAGSQTALCCASPAERLAGTIQECAAASGLACSDRITSDPPFAPYCCDRLDTPGCLYLDPSSKVTCNAYTHPVEYRYCCARAGNVSTPVQTNYGPMSGLEGGIDCEELYDMPSCPEARPKSFCC
ncbi:hypothetical protein ABBQ38_012329 [Trebouxia sp. C0009 RCD-2024]